MSQLLRAAAILGAAMPMIGIAGVYLVVTYLPRPMQLAVPVLVLGIPIAVLWPHRFDRPGDAWTSRAARRLGVIAAALPVAAIVGWLGMIAVPAYASWADNQHRQSLERRGTPPDEIEATVALHHETPRTFAVESAVTTAIPGLVATLVTLGASAIVLRRRRTT